MRDLLRAGLGTRLTTAGLLLVAGCSTPARQTAAPSDEPAKATLERAAEPAAALAEAAEPPTPVPPESDPAPISAAASGSDLRPALTRALDYLQRDGGAWMRGESRFNEGNGCISCHVVGFALWSHNAAAGGGLTVQEPEHERLTAEALEFIARPRVGRPVSWSQLLLGRPVETTAAGAGVTDWRAMVAGTLEHQEGDGRWRARGQFPTQRRPVAESDAVATMWSLLALASIAQSEPADPAAIDRALAWLEASEEGVGSEWLAMRLLVARHWGEPAETEALLARLLAEQRPDGGWSWRLAASAGGEEDPSNAYSTGVALYALRRAGLPPAHPAVTAAVDHLLAGQRDDGTWRVASRLISTEPDEAKDYVYEYWGTAWAVIGLAETLEGTVGAGHRETTAP